MLSRGIFYRSRYSRKRRKATTIVERGEIGNLTIEDYTLGLIEAGARYAPYMGRDSEIAPTIETRVRVHDAVDEIQHFRST